MKAVDLGQARNVLTWEGEQDHQRLYAAAVVLLSLTRANESPREAAERALLLYALEISDGVQTKAARVLKATPRIMNYWLKKYGLRPVDVAESDKEK